MTDPISLQAGSRCSISASSLAASTDQAKKLTKRCESEPALISASVSIPSWSKPQKKRSKPTSLHRKYKLWLLRCLGKIFSRLT